MPLVILPKTIHRLKSSHHGPLKSIPPVEAEPWAGELDPAVDLVLEEGEFGGGELGH